MHESRKACAALAVPDHALALLTVGLHVGLHAGEPHPSMTQGIGFHHRGSAYLPSLGRL